MPCRRWNSKPVRSSPAISKIVATVSALWVANCGKMRSRLSSSLPGAGEIAQIGRRLAREDRIVRQPALLRPLDLGIPVGALDEAHHHAPAVRPAELVDVVDHGARALLIGLDGQPEAVPAGQRRIGEGRVDDVERQLQPVGLLGIDGEVQVVRLGHLRQFRAGPAPVPPEPARDASRDSADAAPKA